MNRLSSREITGFRIRSEAAGVRFESGPVSNIPSAIANAVELDAEQGGTISRRSADSLIHAPVAPSLCTAVPTKLLEWN